MGFSFNGGKDSIVLLHLLRMACVRWALKKGGGYIEAEEKFRSIRYFFFDKEGDSFSELQEFIDETKDKYKIDVHVYRFVVSIMYTPI